MNYTGMAGFYTFIVEHLDSMEWKVDWNGGMEVGWFKWVLTS